MSRKKRVLIILGIILIVLSISLIITAIIIKNNIEKEKESYLNATNNISKIIEEKCNIEKNSEEALITYKYLIQDSKIDVDIKIDELMPSSGVIEVDNECSVSLTFLYEEYSIVKKGVKEAKIVEDNYFENGNIIYYDPIVGDICDEYTSENSLSGNTKGCMKWYVFNDKKVNNTITMILDHNVFDNIRWITNNDFKSANESEETYNNKLGPITINNKLNEVCAEWKQKARLISVEEIAKIIGIEKFDTGSDESYFFDSKLTKPNKKCYKDDITGCQFGWLYDYTSDNCTTYGCLNNSSLPNSFGYWTSSSNSQDLNKAWRVYFDGRITSTSISDVSTGIRPVIEIQKSIVN